MLGGTIALSLAENPFAVLGVSLEATREDIEDAYEDRVVACPRDEPALLKAKQILLTPRTRLGAELRWLPNSEPQRAALLAKELLRTPEKDLAQALPLLPALDRSNVAADAIARLPSTQLLPQLIAAHGQIDPGVVTATLKRMRATAKFPPATEQQVKDQLAELTREHAASAMVGMLACGTPQLMLSTLVEDRRFVSNRLLDELVARYDQWSSPHLSVVEDNLDKALAAVGDDPGSSVEPIVSGLKQWAELSKPIQRHSARSGLDEPRSLRIYRNVRSTCIDLANDHQQFGVAAEIVKAVRTTFRELPTAAVESEEDLALLTKLEGEQAAAAVLKPVDDAVGRARKDLRRLIARLDSSVPAMHVPVVRDIAAAANQARKKLAGTDLRDAPAAMVRALAVEINDQNAAAALALVEGITTLAVELKPAFAGDIATLRANVGFQRLDRAVKQKRFGAAIKAADGLLASGLDADDRKKIQEIKSVIEKRQSQRFLGVAVWGFIIVVGLIVVISSRGPDSNSSPSYNTLPDSNSSAETSSASNAAEASPTSPAQAEQGIPAATDSEQASAQQATPTPDDGKEDQPPIQSGQLLTQDQVRYCVYTKARLETVKPLITSEAGQDNLNNAIVDYNSRCGRFEYTQADMDVVNADLQNAQSQIQADAATLAAGWNE